MTKKAVVTPDPHRNFPQDFGFWVLKVLRILLVLQVLLMVFVLQNIMILDVKIRLLGPILVF